MLEYLAIARSANAAFSAQSDASHARTSASNALSRTEEVEYRVGAIELAIETLVRLGVDNKLFTEQQFLAMARQVDAEDGAVDGRRDLNKLRKLCQKCGKPNGGNKTSCMWCGHSLAATKPQPPDASSF